jgi:hypothetical protein
VFDDVLALFRRDTALLGNDLTEHGVHLPSHVGCIATDVEIGLLLQEVVDQSCILAQPVLNIYFLRPFTGKSGNELEGVSEFLFVRLDTNW